MPLNWNKFIKSQTAARSQIAREKFGDMFGLSAENYKDSAEMNSVVKKQIEAYRGNKEGSFSQGGISAQDKYKKDNTAGVRYRFKSSVNGTYASPPETDREKDASELLVGIIARNSIPKVFVYKGQIWERV